MFVKKECIAMLLAGGQGSRLHVLTKDVAKPAVPFGGKYRIIDFTLSNCINSGIDTVGVLTQYQPLVLNEYIGNGQPWDLDRLNGGAHVLPPYQSTKGGGWYKGTANAIYQNISFIDRYSPDYIVVLSGDHIYKMNYSKMLAFAREKDAGAAIAVLEVEMEEASRFGIMNADDDGRIYEFEEKPENPKSNLASMGVYIFKWNVLRRYLIQDESNKNTSNDFGKDIIPAMLDAGERMFAYPFSGYWKDVGTIDSLWEANMDLLNPNVPLDLYDNTWKIYARNTASPPHYAAATSSIQNSMVSEGCGLYGFVDFSVIYTDVTIDEGAAVRDSIIMPGAKIGKNSVIEYAIIGENAVIGEGVHIGARPESIEDKDSWGVAVVGPHLSVSDGKTILPKEILDQSI